MSVKITYFVHGTTIDNEKGLASGHADIELSQKGIDQSKELPSQIKDDSFDVIFTSNLVRAIDSAKLSFGDKYKMIQDKRLRECDYGDYTQKKKDWEIIDFVDNPYPNGESYKDVEKRIAEFLEILKSEYDGKHVAIVGHQAPQLALEVLTKGKTWEEAITEDWRKTKEWKPGWEYVVE